MRETNEIYQRAGVRLQATSIKKKHSIDGEEHHPRRGRLPDQFAAVHGRCLDGLKAGQVTSRDETEAAIGANLILQ